MREIPQGAIIAGRFRYGKQISNATVPTAEPYTYVCRVKNAPVLLGGDEPYVYGMVSQVYCVLLSILLMYICKNFQINPYFFKEDGVLAHHCALNINGTTMNSRYFGVLVVGNKLLREQNKRFQCLIGK